VRIIKARSGPGCSVRSSMRDRFIASQGRQARSQGRRYLQPLIEHLEEAGLGHVSEIADAEVPCTPRGCPWQAWSVGEALWLDQVVLAECQPGPARRAKRHRRSRTSALVFRPTAASRELTLG
jgi:glycogen debranching enzyme